MTELTLAATLENILNATAFIEEQLDACGCEIEPELLINISMAIDEVFCNIARYAYPEQEGDVTVRFDFDDSIRTATITFTDSGISFDPLQSPDPDITLSTKKRQIGGPGIFMVKNMMDSMEYRRENDMNILTIRKII